MAFKNSDDEIDNGIMQASNIREMLCRLVDRDAASRQITKTQAAKDIIGSQNWHNHRNGKPISAGSMVKYTKALCQSEAEILQLDRFYRHDQQLKDSGKSYDRDSVRAIKEIVFKNNLNNIDLVSLDGFNILVSEILDCRHSVINHRDVPIRCDMLVDYLNKTEKNVRRSSAKRLLIAYAAHLNAYYRGDNSLQHKARSIIDSCDGIKGEPIFYYIKSVIELHWLNKQDMCILSADAMSAEWRTKIMGRFLKIEYEMNQEFSARDGYTEVLVKNMKLASRYNVASLGVEISHESINRHKDMLMDIDKRDAEEGTPPSISIYNTISHAEILIRKKAYDEAINLCETESAKLIGVLPGDCLQISQLKLKKLRANDLLAQQSAASTNYYDKIVEYISDLERTMFIKNNIPLAHELMEMKDRYRYLYRIDM